MSNVFDIKDGKTLPVGEGYLISPDAVLDRAKGELTEAYVIGFDHDGDLYFAGSHGDPAHINMMLDRIKLFILTGQFV